MMLTFWIHVQKIILSIFNIFSFMKIKLTSFFPFLILFIHANSARWSIEQAEAWYRQYNWSAGFNYAPSYAVNEI